MFSNLSIEVLLICLCYILFSRLDVWFFSALGLQITAAVIYHWLYGRSKKGNHAAIKNIRYLLHNLLLTLPMSAKSNQMCGDENTEEVWKVTFYSCNVYMDLWGAISFSKWCHMMSVCLMSFWLYNILSTNPHNNFYPIFLYNTWTNHYISFFDKIHKL